MSNAQLRQDLIAFLQRMDSNGCYSDEDCMAEAMDLLTIDDGVRIVAQWAMDEIGADLNSGRVLASVGSFATLHDYVDANKYGSAFLWPVLIGDCEDADYVYQHCEFWNRVQYICDVWLRAGRPDPMAVIGFMWSAKYVTDLAAAVNNEYLECVPGVVYDAHMHISRHLGTWVLVLGNQEWWTDNLAILEARLLMWAMSEGVVSSAA